MSILDLHADEQVQASLNTAPSPVAPPAKFSAWSAIPRAIGVAAGEVGASAADLVNAARVFRDTPSREIAASGLPTSAFSSELGDTVRSYWNDFKPDPNTATTAEQVLFGFSRGLAKVVPATIAAGPVGAIVAGIEEGMTVSDELRRKGVGADARTKAGMIQGAGLASAALPLLGTTLAETAALYVAGGPGGFMAQQALTRQILRDAGHDQIAAGYDPFDPVGLAVASLIPAGFTAYGLRGQVKAARAKAAADFNAGPVPSEPTPVAAAVAEAVRAPELSPDVVDAAMVNNLRTFGADRVMPAWHAADTFAARLDEAIAERGISVRAGDRSQAGGGAGARSISIADMPEADFMALHGNSVIDVKAHEFAHTFWAGATALPNFKDPANKPLLAEMRQMSKEFRPFVWENHKAHANKPGELMADAMAFWLKHPDRRQDFTLVDKMMRDYDAGGLQRRFPDAVADAYKPAPPRIPPEVVDAAMVQNTRDFAAAQTPAVVAHAEAWRGPVTENPNFKAWFGDSKVVDAEGNPLVVYHGTGRPGFDSFDPATRGDMTGGADARAGFFFTDNPSAADEFTWNSGSKEGAIYPVYLGLKNPAVVRDMTLDGSNGTAAGRLIEQARSAGHDGVIFESSNFLGKQGRSYVVFDPQQIKSAIGNSGRFDPNSASLTDPVPRAAATEAAQARIDATPTEASIGGLETREVPVKAITLSEDVPQFKSDANARGVVEPLGGAFDRTGVAPIQLWERTDGRLEVISGRHRLDLAQRSGEATIPAQVHREADGFGARQAAALDAELNIRDGQGKVRDYVDYFSATGIDRATAEQRGLLARSIGKRAFAIANEGSHELVAAHRAGIVTDEAAVAIAGAAPGDGRLQAVGIRAVQDGKTIGQAANTVRAVKLLAGDRPAVTGDMFGFDDSAMREAESMAKIATAKQREIATRLSAITGAAKRPELAKAEGVNVKDSAAVLRRVEALRAESAAWDNWTTNPTLIEAIRADLHPDGAPLVRPEPAPETNPVTESAAPADTATGDMFGDPIAKLNEPADAKPKPAADPIMSTVAARVADLESTAPDMVVRIAEDGTHVTLADDLAEVRRMVAEGTDDSLGTLDADLIRVAVECALSTGG